MNSNESVITSANLLPTLDEMGGVNLNWIQVNPQRSVIDTLNATASDNFVNGNIDFLFSTSMNTNFIPSRSFLKGRLILTTNGTNAPTLADRLAISEVPFQNMLANASFSIGGQTVSSISQFVGQSTILKYRVSKDFSWLSSVGAVSENLKSFEERVKAVSSDGGVNQYPTTTVSKVGLGYRATDTIEIKASNTTTANPLLYNSIEIKSGGGDLPFVAGDAWIIGDVLKMAGIEYKVVTVTNTSATVHTLTVNNNGDPAVASATTNYSRVRSLTPTNGGEYYGNQVEFMWQPPLGIFGQDVVIPASQFKMTLTPKNNTIGGIQSDISTTLGVLTCADLKFFMCVYSSDKVFTDGSYYLALDEMLTQSKTINAGLNQLDFQVPSSTYAITTFAQAVSSGSDKRVPPSYFGNEAQNLLNLKQVQIQYSNQQKPSTMFSEEYKNGTQYLTQRYIDSLNNSGILMAGSETFGDYIQRGPYSYWSFVRAKDDRSTSVQLQVEYETLGTSTYAFLTAFYRNYAMIKVVNGLVSSVSLVTL